MGYNWQKIYAFSAAAEKILSYQWVTAGAGGGYPVRIYTQIHRSGKLSVNHKGN